MRPAPAERASGHGHARVCDGGPRACFCAVGRYLQGRIEVIVSRALPIVLLLAACSESTELVWVQFNGEADAVAIEVTAGSSPGEPIAADITSTTGSALIGSVWIDPGSGPPGTAHEVRVDVDRSYEEQVGRVEIVVDSPERGSGSFEMVQDSAQLFRWVLSLTSNGTEDEIRTDTLTFRLYELEEVVVEDDGGGLFGL
jgi:hypothetical protein